MNIRREMTPLAWRAGVLSTQTKERLFDLGYTFGDMQDADHQAYEIAAESIPGFTEDYSKGLVIIILGSEPRLEELPAHMKRDALEKAFSTVTRRAKKNPYGRETPPLIM